MMVLLWLAIICTTLELIWEWAIILFLALMYMLSCLQQIPPMQLYMFFCEEFFSLTIFISFISSNYVASLLSLFGKLAVPPVHMWVIWLIISSPWKFFKLFISLYKMIPFFLLKFIGMFTSGILAFNLILAACLLFMSISLRSLIFFSGAMNLSWLLLVFLYHNLFSILIPSFYFFTIYLLLKEREVSSLSFFLLLLGSPPFMFFVLKFSVFYLSSGTFLLFSFLLMLFWVMAISAYLMIISNLVFNSMSASNKTFMFFIFVTFITLI